MNPEISSVYCVAKNNFILLFYCSYFWRVHVTPRTTGWTLLPLLNYYSCFSVLISETRSEKHLSMWKCRYSWEFPKNLTCVILLESPSVFMCLTTSESPSHTSWRVIHVQAWLTINHIKEKQLRSTALLVIDLHSLKWHMRRKLSSCWTLPVLLERNLMWESLACRKRDVCQHFCRVFQNKVACWIYASSSRNIWVLKPSLEGLGRRECSNALEEMKLVWFCNTCYLWHSESKVFAFLLEI